jgi:hypothetical protein
MAHIKSDDESTIRSQGVSRRFGGSEDLRDAFSAMDTVDNDDWETSNLRRRSDAGWSEEDDDELGDNQNQEGSSGKADSFPPQTPPGDKDYEVHFPPLGAGFDFKTCEGSREEAEETRQNDWAKTSSADYDERHPGSSLHEVSRERDAIFL